MAADGDDYADFANNFYGFKDYVFSKRRCSWFNRRLGSRSGYTYRPSEGVLEVYSPDDEMRAIKISPALAKNYPT